jgi:hypothetical protein
MKEIAIALALKYGIVILGVLVMVLFGVAAFLTPYLIGFLKGLTEKIGSSKVAARVRDALDKLGIVLNALITAEAALYKTELLNALKDGQLDNQEIKDISEKLAKKAMEILKPEMDTLGKYLAGELIFDFIVAQLRGMLVEWAQKKLGAPISPFVPTSLPTR